MFFRVLTIAALLFEVGSTSALAQSTEGSTPRLSLELNNIQDVGESCRLTFLTRNGTGKAIEQAVFETVIFDTSGGVMSLSLFDFRDLPSGLPRVRQFDLPGVACDTLGQALINGASTCVVNGTESRVCSDGLSVSSRISVELLG